VRRAATAAAVVALFVPVGCGGGDASGCITADTGAQLCGADAVTWCDATDVTRAIKLDSDPGAAERQRACDKLRNH
jgi:hypothetical protein